MLNSYIMSITYFRFTENFVIFTSLRYPRMFVVSKMSLRFPRITDFSEHYVIEYISFYESTKFL